MTKVPRVVNSILRRTGFELHRAYEPIRIPKSDFGAVDRLLSSDQPLFLVFHMGKVGSSSIYSSLLQNNHNVLEATFFSAETCSELQYIFSEDYCPAVHCRQIFAGISTNRFLRHRLTCLNLESRDRVKIITLTREPIAKLVSNYFQIFDTFFSYFVKKKYGHVDVNNVLQHFLHCVDMYIEIYSRDSANSRSYEELWHNYKDADVRAFLQMCCWPLIWFDRELSDFLDLDIYTTISRYPHSGREFQPNGWNLLIVRHEDFNQSVEADIRKYTSDNSFSISRKNIGIQKSYGSLYSEFLSAVTLPEHFVKLQYNSKYATFFYSPNELAVFSNRWTK